MICIYTPQNTDYTTHGDGILTPIQAQVSEKAGGDCSLSLTHPMDGRGLWQLLRPGNIVKVPIPAASISSSLVGEDVNVWRTTERAEVYSEPKQTQPIQYPEWTSRFNHQTMDLPIQPYAVGAKVTRHIIENGKYTGKWQNYQCIKVCEGLQCGVPPEVLGGDWWQPISNTTPGGKILSTLPTGMEVYELEDKGQYWLYVQTKTGLQGYVLKSYLEFLRTETIEEEPERYITDQLFRIDRSTEDPIKRTITIDARHVSYDLQGNLVQDCELSEATAGAAISRMLSSLIEPVDTTIATNFTAEDEAYTGSFSWKNPISCILDPDHGLVSFYRAKLIRDNWDIFILKNDAPDRGVVLRYGKNIKGLSCERSAQKLVTRVVPVAQDAHGAALMLPEIYIDSPLISSYPVILTEYLKVDGKVGDDWTDADEAYEAMREAARKRFEVDNADKLSVKIKVDFVLLGDTEEYKRLKGLQKVYLYDTVQVIDDEIGMDYRLQVAESTWDPITMRYTGITLGDCFDTSARSVAGFSIRNNSIDFGKLSPSAIARIKNEVSAQ